MLEVLEAVNVGQLWLSKYGLPTDLGAFLNLLLTMGDSVALVVPNGGLSLVTLEGNRPRSLVRVVHSYFSLQRSQFYDHFEEVMVPAAKKAVHQTCDPYDVDRVDPWRTVGENDWIINCNGWSQMLGRTELCVEDQFLRGVLALRLAACGPLQEIQ